MKIWQILVFFLLLTCCLIGSSDAYGETDSGRFQLYLYRFYWTPIELAIPAEGDFAAIVSPHGETIVFQYPKEGIDSISIKRYKDFSVLLNGDTPVGAKCVGGSGIQACLRQFPSLKLFTVILIDNLAGFISSHPTLCNDVLFVRFAQEISKHSQNILTFPYVSSIIQKFNSPFVCVNGVIFVNIESEKDLEFFNAAMKYKCSFAFVRFRIAIRNHEAYLKKLIDHGVTELTVEYHYNNVQIDFAFLKGAKKIRALSLLPCPDFELGDIKIEDGEDYIEAYEKIARRYKTSTIVHNVADLPTLAILRLANNWRYSDVIVMGAKAKVLSLEYFQVSPSTSKMSKSSFDRLECLIIVMPENDVATNTILNIAMKKCKSLILSDAPHLLEGEELRNIFRLSITSHRADDLDIRIRFPWVHYLQITLVLFRKYTDPAQTIRVRLPRFARLILFNSSRDRVIPLGGCKITILEQCSLPPRTFSICILVRILHKFAELKD